MWLCLVHYIGGGVKLPREVMWELSRCLSRGGSHRGETGFTQQAWSCGGRFISAVQSLSHVRLFVTRGFPVHHQLPEFTQTHAHRVGDAIQPSHPLWSPSPPAFNPSQHRSFQVSRLFSSGGQRFGASPSTSVLPMNTQDWSPLKWTGWVSLQSRGLSRVFSNIIVQKHQFFSAQLSSQSSSHIHTWPLEKP